MDNQNQQSFEQKFNAATNTADTTSEFDPNDINQNKIMAILAYFGILVVIPIFAAKESKFARFHANQGLVLFIASVAYKIMLEIIKSIIVSISTGLLIITTILGLTYLVFIVLGIMGIVNAATGKAKELPIIGKFSLLK